MVTSNDRTANTTNPLAAVFPRLLHDFTITHQEAVDCAALLTLLVAQTDSAEHISAIRKATGADSLDAQKVSGAAYTLLSGIDDDGYEFYADTDESMEGLAVLTNILGYVVSRLRDRCTDSQILCVDWVLGRLDSYIAGEGGADLDE